jgi:hypothetical protein
MAERESQARATDAGQNGLVIRKWYRYEDEASANECGQSDDGKVLRRVVIGAVVRNPYAGSFFRDLSDAVRDSIDLGRAFGRRIQQWLGEDQVESYGKACVVGTLGEYEHGNAFLTTAFADPVRSAIGGAVAWIPSTGKVGGPGTNVDIPLAHKDALYVRSHYDTVSICVGDAPLPAEILVLFACATRGRIGARLGGLAAGEISEWNGLR